MKHQISAALIVLHVTACACSAAEPLFQDNFPCQGSFAFKIVAPVSDARTSNWAVKICSLRDGRLLMCWCSTADSEVSKTNRIWVSFSANDGETWSTPIKLTDSTNDGKVLNPCCYTHSDGRTSIYYNLIQDNRFDVVYQTTQDSGKTWSARKPIPIEDAVTSLMNGPLLLKDGRTLVFPICSDDAAAPEHYVARMLISTDNGETWTPGGPIEVAARRGAMEPTVVELKDGRLYCLMRTTTGYQYESFSEDQGKSWSKARQSRFPSPEAMAVLWRLKSGRIAFVWNNNTISKGQGVPRYPLCLAVTSDEGQTWSAPKLIESTYGVGQLSNHGVYQTDSGHILVAAHLFAVRVAGREEGPIAMARFDEAWLDSNMAADKWDINGGKTGGIRLSPNGATLIAGGVEKEQSTLTSKFNMPNKCELEFELVDQAKDAKTMTGVFLGQSPFSDGVWLCFARGGDETGRPTLEARSSDASLATKLSNGKFFRTTVTIQRDGQRVRYKDSTSQPSDWIDLPRQLSGPLPWGFFARNAGLPGRVTVRTVKLIPVE